MGFSSCGSQAPERRLSSCGSWGLERRLSSCGARASLLRGMWDLPGPGLEPVSPALAGGFLTTAPPGKSQTNSSRLNTYQSMAHKSGLQAILDIQVTIRFMVLSKTLGRVEDSVIINCYSQKNFLTAHINLNPPDKGKKFIFNGFILPKFQNSKANEY